MLSRLNHALAIKALDWKIDSKALFSHFAHTPWAILLDSAHAEHEDAQFDIIAFNPIATLTAQNEHVCFQSKQAQTDKLTIELTELLNTQTQALDALNIAQQALYPTAYECQLPFSAGALGSFSYDLGRQLETINSVASDDINLPQLNIGFYDFVLVFDYQQDCWYACHYLGQQALDEQLEALRGIIKTLHSSVNSHSPTGSLGIFANASQRDNAFKLTRDWHTQITKDSYLEKFEQVQAYLLSGDCYQINLTQRFEAPYQGDEWQAYCQLSQANKAPFSAFMRLENNCILSISPERFIQKRATQVQTKPIKGTLPRSNDPQTDKALAKQLQHSEKDRAENLMIVDLLRNDIGRIAAPGSVKVPKLFDIESFPAVHHLVSTITATLDKQFNAVDVLKATFPGGSITGAPKIRAMEIIEELEPSRRSIYCGSIGYISQDGNMDTSITIRTLATDNQKIYCWAGGGIVADSIGEAEYQESFDKVSKILPVLSQQP
ncbi:aminodeoxychorismate synthase component I [Shewanella maritima]|uniref:aminodeoxychorismate synthase component I n=1 Tax=Shewanella maritima TaxID=2520507 RepID=UPI0037364736